MRVKNWEQIGLTVKCSESKSLNPMKLCKQLNLHKFVSVFYFFCLHGADDNNNDDAEEEEEDDDEQATWNKNK